MATKHSIARRVINAAVSTSSRSIGRASLHSSPGTTTTTAAAAGVAAFPPRQTCALRSNAHSTTTLTTSLAPAAGSGIASRRSLSTASGTDGNDSSSTSGRFSDDLEKLISRAGEQADLSAAKKGGGTTGAAVGSTGEAGEGEGEGGEVVVDSKMSARAMKFRAMISKLRPTQKVVVVQTFTPSREPLVDNLGRSYGLGRRKTSTARVWISLSTGEGGVFTVNSRPMIDYFPRDHLQNEILKPLEFTRKLGSFHVRCTTKGGGQAGQAGAIRLGLARALEAHDPWLRKFLKKEGMMERDSRMVERKKPGLKKARKAPQWVKR